MRKENSAKPVEGLSDPLMQCTPKVTPTKEVKAAQPYSCKFFNE